VSVETGRLAPDAVRSMFDRISPVYDAMNRTMTAGLDQRWRRATVAAVVRPGDRVLDACCGTGDLAVEALHAGGRVTGLDFSERMLERARRKSSEIDWVQGDALSLPFEDGSFDAATVGFGVRNLDDLERGLGELRRVLRPGGRVAILEITQPRGLLRPFFSLWFDRIVPCGLSDAAVTSLSAETGRDVTVAEALLSPHRSYLHVIGPLLGMGLINGMAHITGGGITDNLPRVLPTGSEAVVRLGAWEVPPLFQWLLRAGAVPEADALRTFNMGIGMILVVPAAAAARTLAVLASSGEPDARVIGAIQQSSESGARVRYERV